MEQEKALSKGAEIFAELPQGELLEPICLQVSKDGGFQPFLDSSPTRLTWNDHTDAEKYIKYLCHLAGPMECYKMKRECENILKGCEKDAEQPSWPMVVSVVSVLTIVGSMCLAANLGLPGPLVWGIMIFCAALLAGIVFWNMINFNERMEKNRKIRLYCEFKLHCIQEVAEEGFDKPVTFKYPVRVPDISELPKGGGGFKVFLAILGTLVLLVVGFCLAYLYIPAFADFVRPYLQKIGLPM